jgi:DNA-binding PadR family transcriptional regulator
MVSTLESNGWVERVSAPQTGRKEKHYRATEDGERAFAEWVATPSADGRPQRATLYLKLALAGPQDARHLLESIAIQEQACIDRLRAYADNPYQAPENATEWDILARDMIDETTTTQLHGELEWLAKMRSRIEQLLERSPVS